MLQHTAARLSSAALRAARAFLVCSVVLSVCSGCVKRRYPSGRDVVSNVVVVGAGPERADTLASGLATTASPKFLGIWDGVAFEYEIFDEDVLQRDLERAERFYRARGYYSAKVRAARVIRVDEHHVRVEIEVTEGPAVFTREVTLKGVETLPFDAAFAVNRALKIRLDEPFDEERFGESKREIVRVLAERGYAFVEVDGTAVVDIAQASAIVTFEVRPGPKARFGRIAIRGNEDIPTDIIRDNLGIEEGDLYTYSALEDAQTSLVELGVFATVNIRQDTTAPETHTVPVTVVVEQTDLRTIRAGGGLRFDVLQLSVRGRIGWEHRNFLGGMRRFSVDFTPGLVLFPTRIGDLESPSEALLEYGLRTQLRQPSFIEGRTTGILRGEVNEYPLLFTNQNADSQVIGFREFKLEAAAERAFFNHTVFVTQSLHWQANIPRLYLGTSLREGLDDVVVAFPELVMALDLRDDRLAPREGLLLSGAVQWGNVSPNLLGQQDGWDIRVRPELRFYIPLSKHFTFASRTSFGFLFPNGYGETLVPGSDQQFTDAEITRDQQILLFRAFYSGGPNSNRGYPYRGVGPHGILRILQPPERTIDQCTDPTLEGCQSRPLGGLTLWEASFEVRFDIFGPVDGAVFLDASDVTRDVGQIRFNHPHLSTGFGVRYATPVGPARMDIGYRIPQAQEVGADELRPEEGDPGTIFGLPMAIHFGLGEAF